MGRKRTSESIEENSKYSMNYYEGKEAKFYRPLKDKPDGDLEKVNTESNKDDTDSPVLDKDWFNQKKEPEFLIKLKKQFEIGKKQLDKSTKELNEVMDDYKKNNDVKEKQEKTENQVILGSSGIAYPITSIEFKGNESIESQVLQNALKSSELGAQQKLTFKQIIALSDVITSYYRQHGYMVAKAVIPEQDITAGTLTIQILEGRLDSVQVNSPSPEVKERVQEIINAQLPNGSTIERDQVFRAINVASESTGQTIKVDLEAAEKLGGTRVEVNTQELPSYYGSISADNFGTASTGKYNFIGTLGFNSLLTMGDKLIVQLGTTDQTNLSYRYDFNYLVPVGNDGWSVGARLWKSTYQVGSDFSALNP